MSQFLVALISGAAGTVAGSILTWHLMTKTARNKARRDVLVTTAESLQDYRVAYAQWYGEYLSPQAKALGSWAKPPTGKPDPVYLELMRAVDGTRGRLRVLRGALYAHFRETDIKALYAEITKLLNMSAHDKQADCREVDEIAEKASNMIPDVIRQFL